MALLSRHRSLQLAFLVLGMEFSIHSDEEPEIPTIYDFLHEGMSDPEPSIHSAELPAEPFQDNHEPNATWRCLRCDSDQAVYHERWTCQVCGSIQFYAAQQPARAVTGDGTWVYMPHSNLGNNDPSRRRRRRRNRVDHGPPAGDNDSTFEAAEEETPTVDPSVDPSDQDCHGPKLPRGPKVFGDPKVRGSPKESLPRSSTSHPASSKPRALQGDDQILSALRRLLRSDNPPDEEVSSLAGPAKGIKWRGGSIPQPPTWNYDRDDLRAYQKFCKKIDIWKLQAKAYVSPKEMALMFYSSLKGDLEQELEHTPVEEFHCDDGVDKLLLALRKPFEQKLVYQKRKFLSDFENIRRYPGELMRTYINRFRRTSTALNSVGIQIDKTYDTESMGARLLDRSGLTQDSQRLILVSSQQRLDFEVIAEALLLQFPDFRGAPPVAGRDGVTKGVSKGSSSSSSSSSSSPSLPSTRASSFTRSSTSSGGKGNQRRQVWNAQTVDEEKPENLETIDEENYEEQDQQADDGQLQQDPDEELNKKKVVKMSWKFPNWHRCLLSQPNGYQESPWVVSFRNRVDQSQALPRRNHLRS